MSFTRVGVAVVVILVVAAIVATPNVHNGHIASNECSAVASLVVTLAGQAVFHKNDYYGKGGKVYANPKDGRGAYDLYELPNGTEMRLIDRALARAFQGIEPYAGYFLFDVQCDDYGTQFAVCAAPAAYGPEGGRNVFYMDEGGTVYQMDPSIVFPSLKAGDRVPPVRKRLSDEDLEKHWIAVGSG